MGNKERYIFFGIGALLGCLILAFSSSGKYRSLQNQKQTDLLNGYTPSKSILPGQDLNAKKPFDTGPAIATKDSPLSQDQTFLRILIAKGPGTTSSLWRIEETLWKDPHSSREKLVRRQIMHANEILIRLNATNITTQQLSQDLSSLNMHLVRPGRSPKLYYIKLPTHDLDSVPNAINLITSQINYVETAFPSYINNF